MAEDSSKNIHEVEIKKPSVKDLVALGSSEEVTNAVELKRELYL